MKSVFGFRSLTIHAMATGVLALVLQSSSYGAPLPPSVTEARRLNNLGVAYMNQQLPAKALRYFQDAITADSTLAVPHMNAGIALLNLQKTDEARQQMEVSAKLDTRNPRVWYNLGLVARAEGNAEDAQRSFARVLELDPESADAHYLMGATFLERNDYVRAIPEFQRALQVSPLHASAEFGLARALQRKGDSTEARQHLARFQRITEEKLASPMGQGYGDQGSYSLAQDLLPVPTTAGPMIPVSFRAEPLSSPDARVRGLAENPGGGICALDLGSSGHMDIVILNQAESLIDVYLSSEGGKFQQQKGADRGLLVKERPIACAVGDIDNDGRQDLAITTARMTYLFRQHTSGQFEDIAAKAGLQSKNHPMGVTFVDIDHDGDVDLFVTGTALEKAGHPNTLWRNNGNLTFSDWTEESGVGGEGITNAAVLSDINNDRAIDIVTSGTEGIVVYLNPREGKFKRLRLSSTESFPQTVGLSIFDFDKDGWMDIVATHSGAPGVTLWRNGEGKRFEKVPLALKPVEGASGIVPIDFDNDGWIDLAFIGRTSRNQVYILRNAGGGRFEDVSSLVVANSQNLLSGPLVSADANGDGGADLIAYAATGKPVLLQNVGGNRHHSLLLRLRGLADNKMALGTKVEVFAGGSWQKFEISGGAGFLTQSGGDLLLGLGTNARPDIIRLLWPTGVPQDEIEPTNTGVLNVEEIDRRGSSCPVLFTWNGKEYEFVADVIGAAVVGHWISPRVRNTPDPDEWVKISGSQLRPRKGFLSLRFGEPMEEVNYLDNARLVAIDHPKNTEVYPNERFLSDPPFVSDQTIITSDTHPVIRAWDDEGRDVTSILRRRDHHYVDNLKRLSFAGFTTNHYLTLDIGSWSAKHPLRLLMSGFIEYFTANSMYAAWQSGVLAVSPYIDAQLEDGTWRRVIDDMGFPAGLPRTIVVDLSGKLPPGTKQIRIGTNLQIYWDQVLVSNGDDSRLSRRETDIPLISAKLAFRGYPKQIEGKTPGDLRYSYNQVSMSGPFIRQSGMHTRYGEVAPLLQHIDDEYVIFGSGEDIDLEFDGRNLPVLPQGWTRDYFFYGNGYVKDMDFYEAMPYTVSSMPFHGMSAYPYSPSENFPNDSKNIEYQLNWNTRVESERSPASYRFKYEPRDPHQP